ncbi:MAG: hypothetical protein IPM16_08635 [Chloroflexi bacterium]|nr:hypothetical protein [Chloroflexota bacterium]
MVDQRDLEACTALGYVLIRRGNPEWYWSAPLLPSDLISLSRCISRFRLDLFWGWSDRYAEEVSAFGIPDAMVDEFREWCGSGHRADGSPWAVFSNPAAARKFAVRFHLPMDDFWLIGVGWPNVQGGKALPNLLVVRERADTVWHAPVPELDRTGIVLGYDVVGVEGGDFSHSWLCSNLQVDMNEMYGIRPNTYGLIDTYEDARRINDWIDEDEMQGFRAEPEPYSTWLLVSYPLV